MKIYDYDNNCREFELQDKPIRSICVTILSGDETGIVYYEDDTFDYFDAGIGRMMDFNDGWYEVSHEQIEQWMNFYEPCEKHETMSYKRQEAFSLGGKFCDIDALAEACAKRIIKEALEEVEE